MDRVTVYPGQAPRSLDLLLTNRNTMTAIGMLLAAILGTGTLVDGLAISPTAPASLQVQVGQGAIYAQEQVDPTAYSSLAADTTDLIVKQGLVFGTTTLTLTPPAASGQSQVYLVQAAFQEVDGGSLLLPYYNASNPAQPWQGPANAGTSQFTLRQGQCVIGLKAGVAAATGSQTTPAADAGYVGLYAITVANGASTVTAANIAVLATAPFLGAKLPSLWGYGADTGSVNALAVTIPGIASLTVGQQLRVKVANANTASSVTLSVNGGSAIPVTRLAGAALAVGDLAAGGIAQMAYDGTQWQMLGYLRTGGKTQNYQTAGTYSFTVPAGVYAIFAKIWGGGGGGGGGNNSNYGCGGAGGGYTEGWFPVAPLQGITILVGAGGTAGSSSGQAGGNGGTSSFGAFASSTGGMGGAGDQSGGGGSVAAGGTGTGGSYSQTGCNGGAPLGTWTVALTPGFGGGAFAGNGGLAQAAQQGQSGAGPGAGASGGSAAGASGPAQPGAAGQPGAVLLSW